MSGQAQKMMTLLWLTKCLERHTWQIYCHQNLPQRARVFQRPEWGVWPTLLHQAVASAMPVLCLHVQAHMYTPMHMEVCVYMSSCARPHTWVCDLLTRCMCSSVAQVYVCLYPCPDSPHVCVLQHAQLTYTFLLGLHGHMS